MIDPAMLGAAAIAAAAYTLTPGPAFLALLGIGASQGRRAGAGFLVGHLVGDILWAALALVAIIGSRAIGPLVFEVLGLLCGAYLLWIGLRAVSARRRDDGGLSTQVRRPLLRGLAFGLTNPKGYPVAVAMFTALLAARAGALEWEALPALLAAAFAGFIVADIILILLVGAGAVRRLYGRHELLVVRASGLLFVGFAVQALTQAIPALWDRRA